MKDTRDPIEVYNHIVFEKTAWNIGIVEAADRVEAAWQAERNAARGAWSTIVSAPPRDYADYGPLPGAAPENGAQSRTGTPGAEAI